VRDLVIDGVELQFGEPAASESAESLARIAARLLSKRPQDVVLRHRCKNCGSAEHGQPLIEAGTAECWVSFSRTAGYSVAGASLRGPIGVDIESVAKVSRHPVDAVLQHPDERTALSLLSGAEAARYRACLWVAKEAVVKSTGDGLRIDLTRILIRFDESRAAVAAWPAELELTSAPSLTLFTVSEDVVGALVTRY
jgi:phosphopantetheinyl transferase